MNQKNTTKKVIISGYYGFNNFGDEAILQVLVRELKLRLPDLRIVVFSNNPAITKSQLDVNTVNRWSPIEIIKEMSSADMFISGGGSLLQDVTSSVTIYYYLGLIYLARIFGLKTFMYAQGIGPLERKISKIATKFVLSKVNKLTVRDEKSKLLLETLGLPVELTCDPVWLGLDENSPQNRIYKEFNLKESERFLSVNLRPWKGIGMLELQDLASVVNKLAGEEALKVLIMPLQHKQDKEICNDFYNTLIMINPKIDVLFLDGDYTPSEWFGLIKRSKMLIAMRFHALICGLMNHVSLFGLSYDPKVTTLLDSYSCQYITIQQWKERQLFEALNLWQCKLKTEKPDHLNFEKNIQQAGQNVDSIVRILQEVYP